MFTGPNIVEEGLIFAIDAANPKCFTPGNTFGKNLITGGDLTGASGTPGSGTHTPNSGNFPSYNSTNEGVFDFAGGKGINCNEDLGAHSVVTLSMWFYKNSSGGQYFTDARNNGGQWFLSNYSGENINYTDAMRYNFDASYNASNSNFLNNWIHMSVVSSGGGSLLYLNGYEISSHPTFRTSYVSQNSIDEDLGKNFRIGTRYTTSSQWTGFFGPIHIYERALSAEEIYQSFSAHRSKFGI